MQKNQTLSRGIGVIRAARAHEALITEGIARGDDMRKLSALHSQWLGYLQHERLIHLIVTGVTCLAFFSALILAAIMPGIATLVLSGVLLALLICYLFHYYRLENTVQYWYQLGDMLADKLVTSPTDKSEQPVV